MAPFLAAADTRKGIAWNTVDRWLARAAESSHRFNERKIAGLAVEELQVDEIRTICR